jgi:integral membrane protein
MIVGTLHGWLFLAYAVVAFTLGNKANWPMGKMAWTILSGTIPTAVFFVERRVVAELTRDLAPKDDELVKA